MRPNRRQANGPIQASSARPAVQAVAVPFAQRLSCTVAEACEVTGLGRTKLYDLIGEGHLDAVTIGRRRLVPMNSLLKLLKNDNV